MDLDSRTPITVHSLIDYITAAFDKKFVAVALFIGVSKAFANLEHKLLLSMLEHYEVCSLAVVLHLFVKLLPIY
jgi:hypothetical protein